MEDSMKSQKIFAFTLAEVLITLGIIGVVAAITIPSLMSKYRKTVVENRLKDTYAIFANATRLMEGEFDAGDPTDVIAGADGFSPTYSKLVFDTYFRPFIKINYEYPHNECVQLSKSYGKDHSDGSLYIDYNGACYNLMNGVSIIFWAGRKDANSPYLMPVRVYIQPDKKKFYDGVDTFGFQIVNAERGFVVSSGLAEMGADMSENNLVKSCASHNGRINFGGYSMGRSAFCFELIKKNGWKIPANYPLKF